MLRANREAAGDAGPAPSADESQPGLDRAHVPVKVKGSLDRMAQWMREQFPRAKTRVTEDHSAEAYLFRVEQGAPSPCLLISQAVFHHYGVEEIIAALGRHHVAARLRSDPITRLRCVEQEGRITVVARPSWRLRQPQARLMFTGPSHELDTLQLASVIVAALPEAVVVTALDRSVLMASHAATELFGRRPGGLPGMAIDELVAPCQRQEVAERERLALGGEEQRFETTVARADGTERAVAVVTTRLVVAGQLIGTVATLRDITELQPELVRGARARD